MSSLICPLAQVAQTHPLKQALASENSVTYVELNQYTHQLEKLLGTLPKQSVVAVSALDPHFFIALLFASLRKGLILFPLNPKLPKTQIQKALKESRASLFFEKAISFEPQYLQAKSPHINTQIPATYLLTSGSTNDPKICVHCAQNHLSSARAANDHLNYHTDSSWLLSLPLYHVSGLSVVFRTLLAKASLVIPNASIEQTLDTHKVTHISLVPTQLQRLIKLNSLQKLKCILLGGAPIPSSLEKKAKDLNLTVYPTYGLTEMGSQVATFDPLQKKMIILPHCHIKVSISNELQVKGESLFLGYLEKGALSSSLNREGYFETKDLISLQNENFQYLGRKDNLFISGGENIQPEEIEKHLLNHPAIEEAIVLPKPDHEFGHRPLALIKFYKKTTSSQLDNYLLQFLPKYKLPVGYKQMEYKTLKPSRKELSLRFCSPIKE